jgi:hypothetical protein
MKAPLNIELVNLDRGASPVGRLTARFGTSLNKARFEEETRHFGGKAAEVA